MNTRDQPSDAAVAARLASERGTTLTETLVGLGLFLLLSGAMVQVTVQSRQMLEEQEEVVATQQDARGSLLIMSNALYAAGCGVPAKLTDPGATGQNAGIVAATATAVTFRGCFSDPPVRATATAAVPVTAVPGPPLVVAVDTVANFAVGDRVYLYSDDRWAYGNVTAAAAGPPAQLTVNFTVANVVPATLAAGSRIYREELMTFSLAGGALQRSLAVPPAAGVAQTVALNVNALTLTYWDPNGAMLTTFPLSLADRRLVNGVGIDLTLLTESRFSGGTQFQTIQQSTAIQPRNLAVN